VRKLPDEVVRAASEFVEAVPLDWRVGMFGESPPPPHHNHHVTLLTRIAHKRRAALETAIAQETAGVVATFGAPFVAAVERIKHRRVLCVGLHIVSPQLRALRERLAGAVGGDLRYEGDGHVSVCYVAAEHASHLQAFLNSDHVAAAVALRAVSGITFTIDELSINLGPGTPEVLVSIGSASASASTTMFGTH